jgi:hypothetical protein
MHIFIAAPNAFTFFLGQRQPGMDEQPCMSMTSRARLAAAIKPP